MSEYYYDKFPTLDFKVMDVRNMDQIEDGTYDAVIDKACFDAVLCGDNSRPNSSVMLNEVHRVLKSTGVYICVSYGLPNNRLSYFN